MGPEGFLEFRDPLAPASGLPVAPVPRDRVALGRARDAGRAAATRRQGPSLYEAFRARARACRRTTAARLAALADLYRDHAGDPLRAAWHDVAELLVDHDERTALWRHHHTLMAAREIGTPDGHGRLARAWSTCAGTITRRYFPELWDVRLRSELRTPVAGGR